MIETSSTYKQKVLQDGREWRVNAIVTTRNGSTLSITNPNIMENGLSISDGTSEKGKFCVGSFVSKQLTLKIANFDGVFKEDKFDGATIYLKIGLVLGKNESTGEESVEWIKLGVFYISEHHSAGGIITIIAYDAASKFERKYDSKITYPTTLFNILLDACNNCGVPLYNTSIKVDTVVWKAPSEEAITYANVVSYIAQIEASWARINNNGELVLGWYDTDRFYQESGDILNGNGEPTIRGNSVIAFDAYPNSLIKSLVVHGKESQDGSGTPSPSNVRPIHGVKYIEKWAGLSPDNRNLLIGSDFSKVTTTSTISINNGVVTMVGIVGATNAFQLNLSDYALQNMRGKAITGSMYGVGTDIAYGTTNPWIGAELVINYDDGSGDYFNVWGGKLFPSGTSAWSKNEKAYQVKDKEISEAHVAFLICDASGSVQFKLPKWELGTASTEWTLAPEDLPSYQKVVFPYELFNEDYYDAISAQGQANKSKVTLDGTKSFTWYYWHANGTVDFNIRLPYTSIIGSTLISDRFSSDPSSPQGHVEISNNNAAAISFVLIPSSLLGITSSDTTDQAKSKISAWLSSNPVTVVYPLATPQQINGTPISLTAFKNTTVLVDNEGQADITYSTADVVDGGSFYPIAPSIDGGTLIDYSQADSIDAGNFTDYSEADELNGGDFFEYGNHIEDFISGGVFRKNLPTPLTIRSLNSCNIHTSDVKITGVEISTTEWKKQDYMVGSNGYVVSIKQNPYTNDNIDLLAFWAAGELVDFSFRPMEISALDDPSIEAGDVVYVVDDHGNTYPTIVSNIEYSIGDYEKFSADAESESTKQSVNYDVETKAVQSAKDITISGISSYGAQTFNFVNMAAYAMGLYATKQQAADGSYILYWHDKQVLSSSSNVWKLDENSFTVSIDGGTTWKSIDNSTNIISYLLNILGIYTSINNKLPINSPQMTGIPTAPTAADGTYTTQIATTAFVISEISKLVPATGSPLDSYPVGSFYWSSEDTSPASLFGGSWEKIEDIFVLAAGPLHPLGSSGGEASHALTELEMPNHRHVGLFGKGVNQCFWDSGGSAWSVGGDWSGGSGDYTTGYTGGGQAHNTMPPYMAANCWHRIA